MTSHAVSMLQRKVAKSHSNKPGKVKPVPRFYVSDAEEKRQQNMKNNEEYFNALANKAAKKAANKTAKKIRTEEIEALAHEAMARSASRDTEYNKMEDEEENPHWSQIEPHGDKVRTNRRLAGLEAPLQQARLESRLTGLDTPLQQDRHARRLEGLQSLTQKDRLKTRLAGLDSPTQKARRARHQKSLIVGGRKTKKHLNKKNKTNRRR